MLWSHLAKELRLSVQCKFGGAKLALWMGCSYGLTWEGSQTKPALGDYYLDLGDKLNAVCPSCILLIEGTGQSRFLGVDWCASLLA